MHKTYCKYIACLLFVFYTSTIVYAMKPKTNKYLAIVLVSGISATTDGMHPMIELIKKHAPDLCVKHINSQNRISSARNMHTQGEDAAKVIADDPELKNGFIF